MSDANLASAAHAAETVRNKETGLTVSQAVEVMALIAGPEIRALLPAPDVEPTPAVAAVPPSTVLPPVPIAPSAPPAVDVQPSSPPPMPEPHDAGPMATAAPRLALAVAPSHPTPPLAIPVVPAAPAPTPFEAAKAPQGGAVERPSVATNVGAEPVRSAPAETKPATAPRPPVPAPPMATGAGNRLSGMQWTAMGFAVGVVCGALLLMRYEVAAPAADRPSSGPAQAATAIPAVAKHAPVVPPKPILSDVRAVPAAPADGEARQLQDEVERLRREVERRRLRAELEELRRELQSAAPESHPDPRPAAPPSQPRVEMPLPAATPTTVTAGESPAGRATLDFWNRINDVIAREEDMRAVPAGGVTAGNAGSFLDRRIAAGSYAAQALGDLDTADVDPQVTGLVEQLSAWYREGAAISQQGKQLLEDENIETRRGPAGVQWQNAYKQHEQSVQEINAAGARVRDAMQNKYGLAFPPLR